MIIISRTKMHTNLRRTSVSRTYIEQFVNPKVDFRKSGSESLNIHELVIFVLKYVSKDTKNYTRLLNCIILFLGITKKIEREDT